jgi:hypothetical protein
VSEEDLCDVLAPMKDGECAGRRTFVCRQRVGPVSSEAFTECAYVRSAMCRGQVVHLFIMMDTVAPRAIN